MASFLIYCLAFIGLFTLIAVALAFLTDDDADGDTALVERARIEMEVRRAERRLHDVARNSFQTMLEEARGRGSHGPGRP